MILNLITAEAVDKEKLPDSAFALPKTRSWPIHDVSHALIAIQYMQAGHGHESDYPRIKKAIAKRYAKNAEVKKALKALG